MTRPIPSRTGWPGKGDPKLHPLRPPHHPRFASRDAATSPPAHPALVIMIDGVCSSVKGTTPLRIVGDGLQKMALPSLRRPPVKPTELPTEGLVDWGIQYYVYSLIAHVRAILKGLLQVSDAGNVSAAFILCRHVFEWAAHACYLTQNLHSLYEQNLWGEAWELLSAAATGNLWIKRHGSKYMESSAPVPVLDNTPNPIPIRNVVSAYEQYMKQTRGTGDAKDSYSFLSEHSHPNSACLTMYHVYDEGGTVHFRDPDPKPSPLPIVNWCLIDLLTFVSKLLGMSKETTVQPHVRLLLDEIARLAPPKWVDTESPLMRSKK